MDIANASGFTLSGLSKKNVVLGKNGCGKSYLLKRVEETLKGSSDYGRVRYISPERGGVLIYEPGIDQAIGQNPEWMGAQRRKNQSDNFRQQSATLFRRLELLVLREIEEEHTKEGYVPRTFGTSIEKLNTLLDRVQLERDPVKAFRIVDKFTKAETQPNEISSGESELISLGIEFLVFVKECEPDKKNLLLVDEPDVHLHPDLQDRLARFVHEAFMDQPVTLILATHSTALLAGLSENGGTHVAFMRRGDTTLTFRPVSEVDRAILPIFGAHPLSNVFNQAPILLIEGDDDERIWQQAVRSAQGQLRLFPCAVDSIDRLAAYENEVNNIVEAVYDNSQVYSLRDRDLQPEFIDDVGQVVRMRLGCRAAENLMLSNDVLVTAGVTWALMQERLRQWAASNASHQYHSDVQAFIDGGFLRKDHDLKSIRNIIVGLMSNKPWEVLVGQAIATLARNGGTSDTDTLRDYLGAKVSERILRLPAP
jgi:ABC-type cobalamin/Fe3+-siderophores transport system ATPase subunit